MISFKNDYNNIGHPLVLEALKSASNNYFDGYGLDEESKEASSLIQKYIKKEVDIHFLIGGTSANKTVISHILKPYEAVIAVDSGHINVHETGAIEANGHKVLITKGVDGKILPEEIKRVVSAHGDEHMVKPKMVYISDSTEVGSVYTKSEISNLSKICKELDLYLYLDGARLGVALMSDDNDLTLNDIATYCDVFYIGGTKNGALFGEAVVISNKKLKESFRYSIKQNGGMLAKGFITGIMFKALFTNDLYFNLAKNANFMAANLTKGLEDLRIDFKCKFKTNQIFINLKEEIVEELKLNYSFEIWEKTITFTTIRLVTSWSTTQKMIENFLQDLKKTISKLK